MYLPSHSFPCLQTKTNCLHLHEARYLTSQPGGDFFNYMPLGSLCFNFLRIWKHKVQNAPLDFSALLGFGSQRAVPAILVSPPLLVALICHLSSHTFPWPLH